MAVGQHLLRRGNGGQFCLVVRATAAFDDKFYLDAWKRATKDVAKDTSDSGQDLNKAINWNVADFWHVYMYTTVPVCVCLLCQPFHLNQTYILSDLAGQASVHFIDINVYVYLSVFKH